MPGYQRNVTELEGMAVNWWPQSLSSLESGVSIIPELLKTQDKFLSILNISDKDPFKVFEVIETTSFPANLFLKHLVVLSDFGGEQIQRMSSQFLSVFPEEFESGKRGFEFTWKEKNYVYNFSKLPISRLDNKRLGIDGVSLATAQLLDGLKVDMIAILLHGSAALNEETAKNLVKCDIGTLLGNPEELEKYVKQKYIWVSRITGGAQANTLGQIAQTYVVDYLRKNLGAEFTVIRNGHVKFPDDQYFPFDAVVSKGGKCIGVEVSFQVTTNSTIERKAGQAKARADLMHAAGFHIAYVIDGAGNFQRRSAISVICANSDCTVAYSDAEFDELVSFIKEKL